MEFQVRPILFALRIGIILFPLFFVLDWFVYPDHFLILLTIRLIISAYLLAAYLIILKYRTRHLSVIVFSCIFLAAFSISVMCVITGEGFASPYYLGLVQVIIVSSLLFNVNRKKVFGLIAFSVLQYFSF